MKALSGRVRLGRVLMRAEDPVVLRPGGDVKAALLEVCSVFLVLSALLSSVFCAYLAPGTTRTIQANTTREGDVKQTSTQGSAPARCT